MCREGVGKRSMIAGIMYMEGVKYWGQRALPASSCPAKVNWLYIHSVQRLASFEVTCDRQSRTYLGDRIVVIDPDSTTTPRGASKSSTLQEPWLLFPPWHNIC
jgi:hypothetical protein